MSNARALFLDTSTQISRHWDDPDAREQIARELDGRALYCSTYVRSQYKATILHALIILHNIVRDSSDIRCAIARSEKWDYLRVAGGRGTPGEGRKVRQIAYRLLQMHPNIYPTRQEILDRLSHWIEEAWEDLFLNGVETPLCNETRCGRAADAPRRLTHGYYEPVDATCNINKPKPCGIAEFWKNHELDLELLAEIDPQLASANKAREQATAVRDHARAVLQKRTPHGQRCSVHLSDAIIAIESRTAPEPVALHTTDRDHELIGTRLGIPVVVSGASTGVGP